MANDIWELILIPNNRSPIGCKWVFCAKKDALGHAVHYKARLVGKGFLHVHKVDFHETFALEAKFTTIGHIKWM